MNGIKRKKKGIKGYKEKKVPKRSKLPIGEVFIDNFGLSDDEDTANSFNEGLRSKNSGFTSHSLDRQQLTPSKSELEYLFASKQCNGDNTSTEDTKTSSDTCLYSKFNGDISTDESESLSYEHVVNVFRNSNKNDDNEAELVSVDMVNVYGKINGSSLEQTVEGLEQFNESFLSNKLSELSDESDSNPPSDDDLDDELVSPEDEDIETEAAATNHTENVHSYETNDGVIFALEENSMVHVYGMCLLSVLHGEVEILGHKLTKHSPGAKVYSPRGTSLLYLKNLTQSEVPVALHLQNKFSDNFKPTDNCAIVLCEKLEDTKMSLIEKHISQQILPRSENPKSPRIVFQPPGTWNLLKVNEKWDDVIGKIHKSTKMLICGGKGVGKTTFLRFAINRLLMKYAKVRVIDLDPGQSEFTTPGCISIVKVCKPIFGPNYTHLQESEKSILSNINMSYEPAKYVASVKQLVSGISEEIPTLVNYMGYTHDIGIHILASVITQVLPTDVVQITSQDVKKNYKFLLNPQVVEENSQLFGSGSKDLDYDFHQIESMCDENESWTAESRQLREMCILSHISDNIDANSVFNPKSLYKISLDDITITDLDGGRIHPTAINASLVALCSVEDEELRIFECHGWGIVKGIDLAAGHVILMTPQSCEALDKVTHLVITATTLPPSLYMTPDQVIGPMPYVMAGVFMSFGQIPKRSRLPVNKQ